MTPIKFEDDTCDECDAEDATDYGYTVLCDVCAKYFDHGPSDHDERMHERAQMGLSNF